MQGWIGIGGNGMVFIALRFSKKLIHFELLSQVSSINFNNIVFASNGLAGKALKMMQKIGESPLI